LILINEGWCDLADVTVSFHLIPGKVAAPNVEPPYQHSITIPLLADRIVVDVTGAFQKEGVDIDGLIQLGNGKWDQDLFVAPKADGSEERLTEHEMNARSKKCLGQFQDEVGTLAGEISFAIADGGDRKRRVKFIAPVYLANQNRKSIPRPPSFTYDTDFETQQARYQRRVQISHALQPGEADRFTVKVAVAQSSFHRFRATLRDVTGKLDLQSSQIEMKSFVPRSRREKVKEVISRRPAQ
jgi:hypothetical protein